MNCEICGVESPPVTLIRTSPKGEKFYGRCRRCYDGDVPRLVDDLEDANKQALAGGEAE